MNKEGDTLIILTPGFPESEADTTCLPMQQGFVRHLKESYPKLNIIILSFQYPYYIDTYKWFGTTVVSFNGQNKGGLKKLFLRRRLYVTLNEIHSNHKIAGLLSFWYSECALVGKRFADKHGLKHFCWLLGQDARNKNKYPGRTRAKASELIALSDFIQDEFEKNHNTRPQHIIPPGIDTKEPGAVIKERNIDILAAGSLISLKQFDIFLETIAEIKKQLPGIKAVLAGNGPEKEKLQQLIKKNGLQENCILTGELPHDKVLELMQRSKILLHPSSYEGFAGVCQEALYCGAHVISFCRAMKQDIEQWHIVENKETMKQRAIIILQDTNTEYKNIVPFKINDTVQKMMELFTG